MNLNTIVCGQKTQYLFLLIVILFEILYFVYFHQKDIPSSSQYNQVENMLIGQIILALIGVLSLILSHGHRQILYTTILLNVGLMAISIYTLTLVTDLPDQKNYLKLVIFSYLATLFGSFGGFINIASSLLMLNGRC